MCFSFMSWLSNSQLRILKESRILMMDGPWADPCYSLSEAQEPTSNVFDIHGPPYHNMDSDHQEPAFGSELLSLPFCLLEERENHGGSGSFLDSSSTWQSGNLGAQNTRISSSKARAAYRSKSQRYNHIMAERQRREEMNEKYSILRTILPKLTKKDKASILTDTINYVWELEKKVKYLQDFKLRARTQGTKNCSNIEEIDNEKLKDIDSIKHVPKQYNQDGNAVPHIEIQSMGSQAMIKVVCPRSRGLVLRTHKALVDCRVEVLQWNVTTLENNAVHYFTVQLIPGVSASNDEIIRALEEATGNDR